MMAVRRLDPATGVVIDRLPNRGRPVRREPSRAPIEHLRYDWFPLHTKPRSERLAQIILESYGLATFCPVDPRPRHQNGYQRARKEARRIVEYPWHPRLMFVGMERPYAWHVVTGCEAVSAIISTTQGEIRRMDQMQIYQLMRTYGRGRFIPPEHQRFMRTGAEFEVGDAVIATEGPLTMHSGTIVVREINGEMAKVFTDFFGTTMGFSVPVAILAKRGPVV